VSDLSDDHFSHAKKLTYEHKIAIFSVTKHLFFLQKDKTPCPSLLRENKIDMLYILPFSLSSPILKPKETGITYLMFQATEYAKRTRYQFLQYLKQ
jgi:hypothetical protein